MGFDDREDTKSCHLPKARLDMAHRDNVNGRSWRSHRLRVTIRVLFPIKLFFPFHCTAIQRRPHAFSSHYFSCSSPKLHQGYVSMSLFLKPSASVIPASVCFSASSCFSEAKKRAVPRICTSISRHPGNLESGFGVGVTLYLLCVTCV